MGIDEAFMMQDVSNKRKMKTNEKGIVGAGK